MPDPEIFASYNAWSGSPYRWEMLFTEPLQALRTMLSRIERAPHQVAVREAADAVDLVARRTDLLDADGNPSPATFVHIHHGLTAADAEGLRQKLKAEGWSPLQH